MLLLFSFRDNGQPEAEPLDLTSKESVQGLADKIKQKYGKVDFLFFFLDTNPFH